MAFHEWEAKADRFHGPVGGEYVNPPERRPSGSTATSQRRNAQPSSTAMMARARRPWVAEMSGAFGSACLRRVRHLPGPDAESTFALFTRAMPGETAGALTYSYTCTDLAAIPASPFEGIANFTFQRRNTKTPPEKIDGYSADSD